jgi:hypothetical protein
MISTKFFSIFDRFKSIWQVLFIGDLMNPSKKIKITSKALIEHPLSCLLSFLGGPVSQTHTPVPSLVDTNDGSSSQNTLPSMKTPAPYQDLEDTEIPFQFESDSAVLFVDPQKIDDFLFGRHCEFEHSPFSNRTDISEEKRKAFESSAWRRKTQLKASTQLFAQADINLSFDGMFDVIIQHMKKWIQNPQILKSLESIQALDPKTPVKPDTPHLRLQIKQLCFDLSIKALFGKGGKDEQQKQLFDALWSLDEKLAKFIFASKGDWPNWFPNSDFKAIQVQYKIVEQYLRDRIRQRIAGQIEDDDLLNRWVKIVEDKKHLNEDQLIPEILSLLVALNYQLSALIEWSLWYLSANEENVMRLKKEADKWNHKHQKAQEAVLIYQEILRLCPPCYLSIYQMHTPWESMEKSKNIAKDTYVFLSPWVIHRQNKIYAQPERFWPARWLGNLKMNLTKTSFAPFGFDGKESIGELWIAELLPRLLCAIVGTFHMQRVLPNTQNQKAEVQEMQNLKIQYMLSMALRAKNLPLDLTPITST